LAEAAGGEVSEVWLGGAGMKRRMTIDDRAWCYAAHKATRRKFDEDMDNHLGPMFCVQRAYADGMKKGALLARRKDRMDREFYKVLTAGEI
jgi:hypothetical protein